MLRVSSLFTLFPWIRLLHLRFESRASSVRAPMLPVTLHARHCADMLEFNKFSSFFHVQALQGFSGGPQLLGHSSAAEYDGTALVEASFACLALV